jgi:hypothetical protein
MSWKDYTLRKQLLITFSTMTAISLLTLGTACLIFVGVLSNIIYNDLYQAFLNNSQTSTSNIITNGAKLFDIKLSQITNNFPNLMTFNAEDSFRADYPFDNIQSHYNWPGDLINASYSKIYDANITYLHSTINVYAHTPNDIPFLSADLQNTINKTAQMDYLFAITFANIPSLFAGYIATPSKFLRYYPGAVNSNRLTVYIQYNNLVDYWYTQVMSNPNTITYTSPYKDPINNELMITIGRTIHNPYNKNIIGAFGSDIILKSIQNEIKGLNYLNNSRTILFEKSSGYIIADSAVNITSLITYADVTHPSISSNTWQSILDTQRTFFVDNNYYFLSINLETSNKQYILVSIVPSYVITDSFLDIINKINSIINGEIIALVISFIFVFILAISVSILLTNYFVKPLQKLANISAKMVNQIGEANLTFGVSFDLKNTGIAEIDKLGETFKQTYDMMAVPKKMMHENVRYGNIEWDENYFPEPSAPFENN